MVKRERGRTEVPNRTTCPGKNTSGTVVVRAESILDRAHDCSDTSCLDSYC